MKYRIYTQPSNLCRIQIPRPVVVESRLLIEFLHIEEVWGVPSTVSLLHEDLSVRDVSHVLSHLAVKVRNKDGGAEVVGVVKADALTCFLHYFEHHFLTLFLWSWDGFAVVSNMN